MNRAAMLDAQKKPVLFPPLENGKYLKDAFDGMGRALQGTVGRVPLDEQTIYFWQLNRGVRLSPWEIDTIKKMSSAYVNEASDDDIFKSAPFGEDEIKPDRKQVSKSLGSMLSSMANATR